MKVKKHRRTSMTILNKFRTSGHFSLEANVFAILGELLLKTLDEVRIHYFIITSLIYFNYNLKKKDR